MSDSVSVAPGPASLGILAGGGPLPGRVAAAAQAAGRPVFLVGLEGFADPALLAPFPHATARVGAAGRILELLRGNACRDLVLVGPVRRPSLFDLRPDAEGARLLARIGRAAFAAMTVCSPRWCGCWVRKDSGSSAPTKF